jgi:hypothetical protein
LRSPLCCSTVGPTSTLATSTMTLPPHSTWLALDNIWNGESLIGTPTSSPLFLIGTTLGQPVIRAGITVRKGDLRCRLTNDPSRQKEGPLDGLPYGTLGRDKA